MRVLRVVFLAWWLVTAGVAEATVIPGRWDKVDQLARGVRIEVTLISGYRLTGQFLASNQENLVLETDAGEQKELPKLQIQKVLHRSKKRDSAWNGALIGAGASFGVFLGLHALLYPEERAPTHAADAVLIPLSVGAGLILGYAVDRRGGHKREVLFISRP